jgi:hypothetical protein
MGVLAIWRYPVKATAISIAIGRLVEHFDGI